MAKQATNAKAKGEKKSPVTRDQFKKGAKPMMAKIGDVPVAVMPREFSTGTLGWFANGATVIEVDGVPCKVTYSVQLYIANSKEAK